MYIKDLAGISNIEFHERFDSPKKLLKGVAGLWELALPLEEDTLDIDQERQRLERELNKVDQEIGKINMRLENKNFINKAPADVVEENKKRLKGYQEKRKKIKKSIDEIAGLSN